MGFSTGVALGQRQGVLDDEPLRDARPALAYAAVTRPSYAMRGRNQLGTPAVQKSMEDLNPSAIHQRAAEMVLQEKELELQRTALEVERMKEANALMVEGRKTAISNREIGEAQASQAAIEKDYQAGMGRVKDWQGAQDRQLEAGKDIQRQDFKKAMAGLFQGNGEGMKNYINRYGDPNTNVEDIQFNPNGSGEILVTPSARKDGKKQKAMAFKDLEQFSTAYAMFMHPDSAGMLQQGAKGNNGGANLSPDDISKIDERSAKQWDEDNKDIVKGPLSKEKQAEKQAFIISNRNSAIALASRGQGGVMRGGPSQVAGNEGAPGAGLTIVKSGVDKKTGQRVNLMSDGTIVPADSQMDKNYGPTY